MEPNSRFNTKHHGNHKTIAHRLPPSFPTALQHFLFPPSLSKCNRPRTFPQADTGPSLPFPPISHLNSVHLRTCDMGTNFLLSMTTSTISHISRRICKPSTPTISTPSSSEEHGAFLFSLLTALPIGSLKARRAASTASLSSLSLSMPERIVRRWSSEASRTLSPLWLTLVLLVLLLLVLLLLPLSSALMLLLMLEEVEEGVGATAPMQARQPQRPVRWTALWQDLGRA
jgi:hypothetical protein